MATILKSTKNKDVIEVSGYVYHYHSSNTRKTRKYWRCELRDVCNGRCVTNYNFDAQVQVFKEGDHTHERNAADAKVRHVTQSIYDKSRECPNDKPAAVIEEIISQVNDEEVIMRIPERRTLFRNVNRNQNRKRPAIPTCLTNLNVLPPYDHTLAGDIFLQFDSGTDDEDRILVFYSDNDLRHLTRSRSIFADGTFDPVPSMFYQLYSIHGVVMSHIFPLVYVLCCRKNDATYRRIFEHLRNEAETRGWDFEPVNIVLDFELAAMNVLRAFFPTANIHGCYFHYTQSVWCYAASHCGLQAAYHDDIDVRNSVSLFFSLPFIPLSDLLTVFDAIMDEVHEDVVPLGLYIETTYVRGRPARGRRKAIEPRYPPTLWNVYDLVLQNDDRTNNVVEGWHSRFQKMINTHHASIWKFLERIQKDQKMNEVCITQLHGGHTRVKHPIKKKYAAKQAKISNIVAQYNVYKDEDNIFQYLRAISYNTKLRRMHVSSNDVEL